MHALVLENVWKEYSTGEETVVALRGVSVTFRQGEFVAIVGRSGCGKTTLLNICGAMDFPTRGSVSIAGENAIGLSDAALTRLRRRKVGFVFQFFQLLPTLTAVENVELPLLLAGEKRTRERALESLDWVGIKSLAGRFPHQLSGGQCQRVAIARSLVHQPEIVLADEPIGNLDTVTGAGVLELLRRTAAERGTTILMATHSAESAQVCHTIVRLRDGAIAGIERR
jgi:ABC-type lipoprotein export system ATPase subunit